MNKIKIYKALEVILSLLSAAALIYVVADRISGGSNPNGITAVLLLTLAANLLRLLVNIENDKEKFEQKK